jgi:hypothetical protein
MKPKRKRNYINNRQLYEVISDWKKALADNPDTPIPNYIGEAIILIANRLSSKSQFCSYSYRDEMIGDGIENTIMYIKNFDPAKSQNPFAYITQIIKFSFIRRIQKEKKQQYVKLKNIQNHFTFEDLTNEMNDRFDRELYENNQEFIRKFEKNLVEKKQKSIKQKSVIDEFIEE